MSLLKMNEHGLSELLESVLAQITALANVAQFTVSNANGSIGAGCGGTTVSVSGIGICYLMR